MMEIKKEGIVIDKNSKWKLIKSIPDEDIADLKIEFNLSDLKKWFGDYIDKWWLRLNMEEKKGCVENEGVSYEYDFYGKIIHKLKGDEIEPLTDVMKKYIAGLIANTILLRYSFHKEYREDEIEIIFDNFESDRGDLKNKYNLEGSKQEIIKIAREKIEKNIKALKINENSKDK